MNRPLKKSILFIITLFMVIHLSALQVKTIKKSVHIHDKPFLESATSMQIVEGTLLQVVEKTGHWYRVILPLTPTEPDKTGYIYDEEVMEIQDPITENTVDSAPTGDNMKVPTKTSVRDAENKPTLPPASQTLKKDKFFLMGIGMLRLNFAHVEGNEFRFRYTDLGLPSDFSTRERASFMVDGTFGHGKYTLNGHVDYDPENRITEPPLDFLINAGNDKLYLSAGDYRMGVMMDSVFSRYAHPFRGGIIGARSKVMGIELTAGLARGESGIEELVADSGSGPYYLNESPILRGSEAIYLITKSSTNPDMELRRTPLVRNRDYYIDYDRGSILFTYSLYPYDELGNPVSMLVAYQFESLLGRFSRAVMGLRAFIAPLKVLKLTFSYIADADKNQSLDEIFKNQRGIYSFGMNVDTKPLTLFGEFSFSSQPELKSQNALFGGGILTISKQLRLFFNGWTMDTDFPTFANKQLQYGYSLYQIFPSYAQRNIFLSPFQFTRNLGAELYPFSLARLSVDESEGHGFFEWVNKTTTLSTGYGIRQENTTDLRTDTLYLSAFHDGKRTKVWGKAGMDSSSDPDKLGVDSRTTDVLLGLRQQLFKFAKGDIFVQADYKRDWTDDFLNVYPDTIHQTYSIMAEYLTGTEGLFAGYRKETLTQKEGDHQVLSADIYELGLRHHVYKGFFLDSRYRQEESTREGVDTSTKILSLGAGLESKQFRAMARYETQLNQNDDNEGRRKLWSLFLFGAPLKRMSISLQYYHQIGKEDTFLTLSFTERSEEQLSIRFLWRPWQFLNLYSQWRYDTNLELYPPLDRTKSNSLAEVHGLKLTISKRFEFLANYKLIKVWGPIENRKYAAAAELGYLVFRHFRIGIGAELIDFKDNFNTDANFRSTVGYLKLVALY